MNNRYIRTQEEFKAVNEYFIGKAIKKAVKSLKNKASKSFSKKYGSIKELEKALDKYKASFEDLLKKEMQMETNFLELEKERVDGKDVSSEDLKKAKANSDKMKKLVAKQKDVLKAKYNKIFSQIAKDEKDESVKDYIDLRKHEIAEEILAIEMKMIQDIDIDQEDIKSSEILNNRLSEIEGQMKSVQNGISGLQDKLENSKEEEVHKEYDEYDEEKEIEKKEKTDYVPGSDINYLKKDGEENSAKISDNQSDVASDMVRVVTDNNEDGFIIKKKNIVAYNKKEN